jgi:hypothetical protein
MTEDSTSRSNIIVHPPPRVLGRHDRLPWLTLPKNISEGGRRCPEAGLHHCSCTGIVAAKAQTGKPVSMPWATRWQHTVLVFIRGGEEIHTY